MEIQTIDDVFDSCFFLDSSSEDKDAIEFIEKILASNSESDLESLADLALKRAEDEEVWQDVAFAFTFNKNTPDSVILRLAKIINCRYEHLSDEDDYPYISLLSHPKISDETYSFIVADAIKTKELGDVFAFLAVNSRTSTNDLEQITPCSAVKYLYGYLLLNHKNCSEEMKATIGVVGLDDIDDESLYGMSFLLDMDIPVELKKRLEQL